jgi:dTDP-4-dehydrorhamnose reductase
MILVTGGNGQLARAFGAAAGTRALRVVGRPAFDFDRPETLRATLDAARPALVVNAAAYTAVDKAESEPDAAFRANRDGPAVLAAWCAEHGARLIHVSTDYVFDGRKGAPYVEEDATNPTGVYGASKLGGEAAVLASGAAALVLRTSWVYSAFAKNFVLTMLDAARRTDRLRVVADQHGCPTSADDLAAAILALADRWDGGARGVFHAAGSGATTWHGLALAVFARAARHGRTAPAVAPIATADWPTPARRPADSRLDSWTLPWRERDGAGRARPHPALDLQRRGVSARAACQLPRPDACRLVAAVAR